MTEGYHSITVRAARPDDRVDSGAFTGLDVPEITRVLAETAPDVVLITGWYSVTLVRALFACRRMGVPTLYRGDSHLLSGPRGWKRPIWTLKTRILLRQFDGFLSPGVRVRDYLKWYGVPERRIFHVPHAVDNQMFAAAAAPYRQPDVRAAARLRWGIDPDGFVVLFVGKLTTSKRPLNVVRAMARLAPGATLMVVGSGPLESAVRDEAARLNVAIKMVGFRNQSELGEPYGLADCLTLPSDFPETWGLVVNEALATGLPCVVSNAVGCAPDLIRDGETGYVYPLDDIEALAMSLARVRHRKALSYDWGPACRAFVGKYSYDAMTEGVVRASRSVITSSVGPEPSWRDAPQRIIACCGQMVIAGGLERMTFEALRAARSDGAEAHAIVNGWENFRITPLAEDVGASWSVGPYYYSLTRRQLTPLVVCTDGDRGAAGQRQSAPRVVADPADPRLHAGLPGGAPQCAGADVAACARRAHHHAARERARARSLLPPALAARDQSIGRPLRGQFRLHAPGAAGARHQPGEDDASFRTCPGAGAARGTPTPSAYPAG